MYILSINLWFQRLMKQFFFGIDQVVYNAISSIYDLLIAIARTSVFSQADILDMADRIYKLLAIFMIFKVTLSLITYVVNPDDFSDKNKGLSKLAMNIIISLGMLILTPYIFNLAFSFQTIILEDNTLATLIFDTSDDENSKAQRNFINSAGDEIAFITMSAFFTPNTSITELQNCIDLTDESGLVNTNCSGIDNTEYEPNGVANSMYALTKGSDFFKTEHLQNYVVGINKKNLGLMFRQELAVATDSKDRFVMDYKYIFSTVVGVVVALLLISFCMDVALRSIKLGFFQLIAPIPILSYVDPKSGKDGMFKKWYQACFKTYLSLFIRLLALYFSVFIIQKVSNMRLVDVVDGSYVTNAFIKIFVIIGALMFAKDFPKILESLGIKLDGGGKFTLNPLRKMENEMMGGKYLKKPNDALKNFAKDGFGLGTAAKKTISGLDAKAHGKSFKSGASRYKGGFGKWLDKQKESYLPYTFEAEKDRRKGEENQAARSRREGLGRPMATTVNESLDKKARLGVVGKDGKIKKYKDASEWKKNDYASYARAKYAEELSSFSSGEYRDSYARLAESKIDLNLKRQAAKDIDQKYQSALSGGLVDVGGVLYGDPTSKNVREYMAQHPDVKIEGLDALRMKRDGAEAAVASAEGKVDNAKREHEDVKLKHQGDARLEMAYDEFGKTHSWDYDDSGTGAWDRSSSVGFEVSDSSSHKSASSDDKDEKQQTPSVSVMDRVEAVTGVSRERAVDNGATISAIVEATVEEIKKEIETLKKVKDATTDRDTMVEAAKRIQTLEREIEDIRRRNS